MNRVEYMRELEALLSDIPAEEREDAINYYNDYFDAGGVENEESTIASLGTPEHLANTIKLASMDSAVIDGEFTETGFHDGTDYGTNEIDKYTRVDYSDSSVNRKEKKRMSGGMIALIVILAIFACPVLIPVAFAILMVLFGVGIAAIVVVIAVAATVVLVGVAGLVFGFVGIAAGICNLFSMPFNAMVLLGGSLIALAVGLLLVLGCIWIIMTIVPPVVKFAVSLFKKPVAWIKEKRAKKNEEEGMKDE